MLDYKPTKNPFETPNSIKEEPVIAKAEPKTPETKPPAEPKPKTDTERLNIKPEREPNQLDKIKNKLDELRKKLFNEKPTSPERPSNPDFADVPCLATRPVPWDVAIGLVEGAEAKVTCGYRYNGKEISKAERAEVIKKGGDFKLEDIDVQGKVLSVRQDIRVVDEISGISKLEDVFRQNNFIITEDELLNALSKQSSEINLKNGYTLKESINTEVKGLKESGINYDILDKNNKSLGTLTHHPQGHSSIYMQQDANASKHPHFNYKIKNIYGHIFY